MWKYCVGWLSDSCKLIGTKIYKHKNASYGSGVRYCTRRNCFCLIIAFGYLTIVFAYTNPAGNESLIPSLWVIGDS